MKKKLAKYYEEHKDTIVCGLLVLIVVCSIAAYCFGFAHGGAVIERLCTNAAKEILDATTLEEKNFLLRAAFGLK